jgi:hypothetical protein
MESFSKKKGLLELRKEIKKRIIKDINKPHKANPWDGRQTPLESKDKIVFYAQHATGTCCRKCIEEWHGINRDIIFTEDQIQYLIEIILYYIKEKIPSLDEHKSENCNLNTRYIPEEKT